MKNQALTKIRTQHERELASYAHWANWMTRRIADGLATRFRRRSLDGHIFVPRIADAVTLHPWYHVVVMDPQALGPFSKHQLSSEDTLGFLTGMVERPVRAVTVIPGLEPGQPTRHGLAYVVTMRDIPPVELHPVLEAPLPKSIEFDPIGDYPAGLLYQWCLGFDGQKLVWCSLKDLGHILIGGTTQYGKSSTWKINLLALLLNHSPELLRLAVIDPKGLDTAFLDSAPHLLMPAACDGQVESARQVMARLAQEVADRRQLMRAAFATTLEDYNRKTPRRPLPLILGIWDEFAALAALAGGPRAPMYRFLVQVINQGASLGVHMVLTTQTPTAEVVNTVTRSQCDTRIVLHCTEAGQFKASLGLSGYNRWMGKLNAPGRAMVRVAGQDTPLLVQMPYVPPDQVNAACRWSTAQAEDGPIAVTDFPFLTSEARRLVAWAKSHPDEFMGGMSLPMLKRAFDRPEGSLAEDGGEPISEWRARCELDALKARGLLVRASGTATLPYQMTEELTEMVESRV
ncbi:MAG: DNA translocase FtsK [Thermoflexales bacterium]|nr:DNA translocase FtsK [Thermoflexales bacterium]